MEKNEKEIKAKKRKPRVIEIIGYILIFAIIILLSFVIISNLTGNIIFIFGKTTAWVMTPSMEPIIPERSYILISKVDASEVKVGDIIIFKSDDPSIKGAFNTHRVIEIIGNNEEFVTKGDANIASDQYTAKANNVLGRYERNLPTLTSIGRFMYSSIGLVITLTAIFVIVMIMYLPDIMKQTKEKEKIILENKQKQIEELVQKEIERLQRENVDVDSLGNENKKEE